MTNVLLTAPDELSPRIGARRTRAQASHSGRSLGRRATAIATAAAMLVASWPVHAQQGGPPLLRDAETEQLLRDYTRPILRAAGLEKQNIQVVIINDPTFNAFVADGRRIFVNYGALRESDTPNQIIGVLAHETGHLAGGHLSKLREQVARAQTQMIIAMLLGLGAAVAGGRAGTGSGGAAMIAAPRPPSCARCSPTRDSRKKTRTRLA